MRQALGPCVGRVWSHRRAVLPGLDAAVRVSDYNTAGRTVTNKFGIDWAPIRGITLRGTYGKAGCAPNIGERRLGVV